MIGWSSTAHGTMTRATMAMRRSEVGGGGAHTRRKLYRSIHEAATKQRKQSE